MLRPATSPVTFALVALVALFHTATGCVSNADTFIEVDAGITATATDGPRPDRGTAPSDSGVPASDSGTVTDPDVPASPIDTGGPSPVDTGIAPTRDTGAPPVDTGNTGMTGTVPPAIAVALPAFTPAVTARVRAIRTVGVARGNRIDAFAKIGDSITEAGGFLSDIGEGWYELGSFSWLDPTIRFFRSRVISGRNNSFNRPSVCAMGGWVSSQALDNDPASPLRTELNATRPAYAIVMYGTNDLDRGTADGLEGNLDRIARICEEFGTVPVLSTIPDRLDNAAAASRVNSYNDRIRGLAQRRNIPLIDYWAAMRPLPRNGIEADGIHPSIYRLMGDPQAAYFTSSGLAFGYNMRNLTSLLMLDRLRNLSQ